MRFIFLEDHTGCDGEQLVEEGGPDTGSQDRELLVRAEASKDPLLSPPAFGFLVETGGSFRALRRPSCSALPLDHVLSIVS